MAPRKKKSVEQAEEEFAALPDTPGVEKEPDDEQPVEADDATEASEGGDPEQIDAGDPVADELQRTSDQDQVKYYNRLLDAVRERQKFLASTSGRALVKKLLSMFDTANEKVWTIEKMADFYGINAKREVAQELLTDFAKPVEEFNDYASGMRGDLFGGHVKHSVVFDEETFLITITGPDEDLPIPAPVAEEAVGEPPEE